MKHTGGNIFFIILGGLTVLQVFFLAYTYLAPNLFGEPYAPPRELDRVVFEDIISKNCSFKVFQIEGTSLQPAYMDGSMHVFRVWDQCPLPALIESGSVVILDTAQHKDDVVKFVKGLPWDSLRLETKPGGESTLLVNGQELKNSLGNPYSLSAQRRDVIEMYIEDYNGHIPTDAYLLLWDDVSGTLDSTRFWLVHVSDIVWVLHESIQTGIQ